ncbi:hypothetical protein BGZ95_000910 [Linnemannia exigua]|uniref:F-box domain-containing protein n=1 Tax=Linnemannia exigua TaxID=604196 RepID=A0AAD4DJD3_9FUNG|nr:hypothetical protein BGZ95_000910 [Linnemannia exigua]
MNYQLDAPPLSKPSTTSSCSIITSMDNNSGNNTWSTEEQFISLRCRPTLTTLPPELLSKISYNVSLCDYSFLSRTCSRLHSHLFHPAELVLFLKTRYRLSIQSGSIIIFAYLANMQVRAPLLLERIFEDFFADSPLRLLEEQRWKQHCQEQRQQLSNNTFQLNQAILSKASNNGSNNNNSSSSSSSGNGTTDNSTCLEYQRMDAMEVHKAAEKARRQAKCDAVRMLGVLYALDKTHIGPSSSTNALVLSGACDPPEVVPLAPAPATATEMDTVIETGAETETGIEVEARAGAGAAPEVFTPLSLASASAFAPASIAPRSYSRTRTTAPIDTEAETDDSASPSFMYHVASSPLSAACELSRQRSGQGSTDRSHSFQEGHRQQQQQGLEMVSRSRSTSLDYSDLVPHHHHNLSPQPHQSMTTHARNVRKRPSPSLPSKDGKVSSSPSSSSWWDSSLTQQHAHSDGSRFSPSRARSPPSVLRHYHSHSHSHYQHQQRQRSPTPISPSSSSSSLTFVLSPTVPGSRAQSSGSGAVAAVVSATATSGGPSPTSPFPSATVSSISPTSASSLPTSSSPSLSLSASVQQEEARQRFFDRRNKRHMNLRAMAKERAMSSDRETMEYAEYQSAMSPSSSSSLRDRIRRGCWTAVDQVQDFDMDMLPPYYHRRELERERARNRHEYDRESVDSIGLYDQGEGENDVPMDVDVGYSGSGSDSRNAGDMDEYMYCDSTTPTPTPATTTTVKKSLSSSPSSSSLACPPPATFPTISPQRPHLTSNDDSFTPFRGPLLLSSPSPSSLASCSSSYSSAFADRNWPVLPTERENESAFGATPLGISVPTIEANTNSSSNSEYSDGGIERWHGNKNGNGSGSGSMRGGSEDGSSTLSSSWRMMALPSSSLSASSTPSFLFGSQGSPMRLPRRISQGPPQQQQLPPSHSVSASAVPTSNSSASATTSPSTSSTPTMTVTIATPTTTTTGTQQKMQQILNRQDKIAFLTKYTDRMHLKLQALGIEDWGQGDIQRKKTYQLMIQHNDKTGEKDLVKFYFGRYGGSVTSSSTDSDAAVVAAVDGVQAAMEPVAGAGAGIGLLGLSLQQEQQGQGQGQGQQQQGTPVVVQA